MDEELVALPQGLPGGYRPGLWGRARWVHWWNGLHRARRVVGIALAWAVFGHALRGWARWRGRSGQPVTLDLLEPGARRASQAAPSRPSSRFSAAPLRRWAHRKSRVMRQAAYPPADYGFRYDNPPESGNATNGVGETVRRRPRLVFHTEHFNIPLRALELWFRAIQPWSTTRRVLRIQWQMRRKNGPLGRHRWDPPSKHEATARLKTEAMALGAAAVGVTGLEDNDLFEGFSSNLPHAVSLVLPMPRETLLEAPSPRACRAILDTYVDVGQISCLLAERIRALGWNAIACGDIMAGTVLHIPIAVRAGLGQLGKHGSLITKEHGSNVRLATVLTDLPLEHDRPEDLGVDAFCLHCRICETNCPPGAIGPEKTWVRGQRKWYVDFDLCAPYFVEHHSCGICIEVCPWSEPGRGTHIATKTLARRNLMKD